MSVEKKQLKYLNISVDLAQTGENWKMSQWITSFLLPLDKDFKDGTYTYPDFSVLGRTFKFYVKDVTKSKPKKKTKREGN